MLNAVTSWLFNPSGLTAHGFCLLWEPGLIWTHALADFLTGATYFSIPLMLAIVVGRRRDILFRPIAWLFAAFILLCGITHWLDLATLWVPAYGVQALVKVATAAVSALTALALWRVLPMALALPSLAQMRAINESLRQSKDFLDRIGRVAGVGGWEVDIASGRLTWTSETYRIHRAPEDFAPTLEDTIRFYTPEAQPVIRAAVERGMAEGQGWDLELPLNCASGEPVWVRAVGTPAFDEGKPVRLIGACQDITARMTAQLALQRTNERMTLATNSGRIGIWDWDIGANALIFDAWMFRLYGLPSDGVPIGPNQWQACLHPDDRQAHALALQAALDGVAPYDTSFRIVWPDGSLHYIQAAGQVSRAADGRAERMIGTNWDVTESTRLSNELREQHELLRVTLESIGDGVITTDAAGRVTWLNPIAEQLTGWSSAEACGRNLTEVFRIVHEESRLPAENPVAACLSQGKVMGLAANTVLISRHGNECGIADSASPICDSDGRTLGMVLVFHDVTEQRRLAREMTYRASHDSLTGLVNRGEFESRLRRVFARAQTEDAESSLLYLDLDQFKIVNDSCGHAIGDQLLQQVTKVLQEIVRTSDTLARLGGDEFGILLEDCPFPLAQRLAQRICDRMEDFRFLHDGRRFRIGVSIGLVPVHGGWPNIATIQQAGDGCCYAAKEAGRNRVHAWTEGDAAMRARRGQIAWAPRLEQALDEDGFVLFFQQIVPVNAPGEGLHAEILLRLKDADGGLVSPGAFMGAAERFNLASRIDRWVLRAVLDWMKETPVLEQIATLSVNLSGQSVGDRSFHTWAADLLAAAGPRICHRLCLEITETAAITKLADARLFIDQVHQVGVRVALDDFGAGASSFGYLREMPADFLKIDGKFVRGLLTEALDVAAVRCFVDVARSVGVQTVAEFVEDPEMLRLVGEMGVHFAQGYLIHRPVALSEFGAFARGAARAAIVAEKEELLF